MFRIPSRIALSVAVVGVLVTANIAKPVRYAVVVSVISAQVKAFSCTIPAYGTRVKPGASATFNRTFKTRERGTDAKPSLRSHTADDGSTHELISGAGTRNACWKYITKAPCPATSCAMYNAPT